MNELYIINASTWIQRDTQTTAELEALKESFGKRVARRMTRLGMMVSHVLKDLQIETMSSVVYATTYSETRAIEKFLASFPYPSPQGFQTSIHPSGVEQFLIQHRQAVDEYFPLAGDTDICVRGLDTLLGCRHDQLIFCGGEERGTWLQELSLSSDTNYAWGLQLARQESPEATGRITWDSRGEFLNCFSMDAFVAALSERSNYRCENEAGGFVELTWI